MVLHKLHAGGEICLVELVRDVPAERAELTTLLTGRKPRDEINKPQEDNDGVIFLW